MAIVAPCVLLVIAAPAAAQQVTVTAPVATTLLVHSGGAPQSSQLGPGPMVDVGTASLQAANGSRVHRRRDAARRHRPRRRRRSRPDAGRAVPADEVRDAGRSVAAADPDRRRHDARDRRHGRCGRARRGAPGARASSRRRRSRGAAPNGCGSCRPWSGDVDYQVVTGFGQPALVVFGLQVQPTLLPAATALPCILFPSPLAAVFVPDFALRRLAIPPALRPITIWAEGIVLEGTGPTTTSAWRVVAL